MKKATVLCSIIPLLITSTAPAAAAQPFPEVSTTSTRTAAFFGTRIRLSADKSGSLKPIARLAAGTTHLAFSSNGAPAHRPLASSTLELGLSAEGRPNLYMAGQRLSDVQQRLGFGPAGAALLAVGGVALLATAGAAAAGGKNDENGRKADPRCLAIGICPP